MLVFFQNLGNTLIRLVRLVRLLNLCIIAFTQYTVAFCLIDTAPDTPYALLTDSRFFLLVFSTLLVAAAGYMINDYYDIKIDLINKPGKVVVGSLLPRRSIMVTHLFLNLMGIGLASWLNIYLGIIHFVSGFLLWLYSNRLKCLPFVGNLTIALLTAVSLWVVAVYFLQHHTIIYVFAGFAFFTTLMREVIKDMEDVKGDRAFGCKTLPIIWGQRKTKQLLYQILLFFISAAALLVWYTSLPALKYYFQIMCLPAAYFVAKLYRTDTRKGFRHLSLFLKIVMLSGIVLIWLI